MGFSLHYVQILAKDLPPFDRRKKLDVLTIGNQDCYFSYNELIQFLKKQKIQYQDCKKIILSEGFNFTNDKRSFTNFVHQKTMFECLGFDANNVFSLDYSDYENANILHDLNIPIKNHNKKFSVIIDSGSIEHIFSVNQAIKNLIYLNKPNGLIIHLSPICMINHGYYNFNHELFEDVYSLNNYKIINSQYIRWKNYRGVRKPKYYELYLNKNYFFLENANIFSSIYYGIFKNNKNKVQFKIPNQGYYNSIWNPKNDISGRNKKLDLNKYLRNFFFTVYKFSPEIFLFFYEYLYKLVINKKNLKKIKIRY